MRSATVRPARRARDTKPAATPRLTAARCHEPLLSAAGSRRVSGWGLHQARVTARVARDQLVQVTPLRVRGVRVLGPADGEKLYVSPDLGRVD